MVALTRSLRSWLLVTVALAAGGAAGALQGGDPLAQARELLDARRADEAIELLDRFLGEHNRHAEAHLLRSTGHFILGERKPGEADLNRALKLDPTLRQAWLNRAALRISEEEYDEAYDALLRAKELDPSAPDNDLNIGVVRLLRGELQAGSKSFELYLERSGESADSVYVVASNYALAGYGALALQHLRRAIEIDERSRLRARTDPNFGRLSEDLRFQDLLHTDAYVPPPGSYRAARLYETPYVQTDSALLGAVIDALRKGRLPFSPHVEVTPDWALIQGELRIKVSNSEGQGRVELIAPADRFTPAQWESVSQGLFRQILYELSPKVGPLSSSDAH